MTFPESDERSSITKAYAWASRITTVSLEMVLPGLGGYWLDGRLGSLPAFTLVGFSLGLILGIWHLIKMTAPAGNTNTSGKSKSSPTNTNGPTRDA